MVKMRAKMKVTNVEKGEGYEKLNMTAVCRNEGYPLDGSDENNTFSKFTPSADLQMYVNNPSLHNQFKEGQEFYLDFTLAE